MKLYFVPFLSKSSKVIIKKENHYYNNSRWKKSCHLGNKAKARRKYYVPKLYSN
jgi:hypothetical protein